jgi:hypothetical protein
MSRHREHLPGYAREMADASRVARLAQTLREILLSEDCVEARRFADSTIELRRSQRTRHVLVVVVCLAMGCREDAKRAGQRGPARSRRRRARRRLG